MFALIFVDLKMQKVLIARDHLGIKPLYYYRNNNEFIAASEVKAIKSYRSLSLNERAVSEQFYYRSVAGTNTLFRDIKRVPQGGYIEFSRDGEFSEGEYFQIRNTIPSKYSKDIQYGSIKENLITSIKDHTVSDVGYNIQLSGGIDSTYITSVLATSSLKKMRTYSVELENDKYSEKKYQKKVVDKFNNEHHSITITNRQYSDLFESATWHMDFPIIHSSCPMLMALCGEAAKTSKVILTGEGADELFLGYSRYSIPIRKKIGHYLSKKGLTSKSIP